MLRYLSVRRSVRGCDSAANSTLREGVTVSPASGSDVGVNISLSRIPLLLSRPCISRGPLGRAVRDDVGDRTGDSVSGGVVATGWGIADPCEPREGGSGVQGKGLMGFRSGTADSSGSSIEKLPSEFCETCRGRCAESSCVAATES